MIRRACVLGALIAVVFQGSTGGHMLLVEHTRCAAHGELVHDAPAHHHASESDAKSSTQTVERSTDRSSEETHEHCALTVDRRDASARVAGLPIVRPPARAEPAFLFIDALVVVDTKRFRTAPKHSPPA